MFIRLFTLCLSLVISACASDRLTLSKQDQQRLLQQLDANKHAQAELIEQLNERLRIQGEEDLQFYAPMALSEVKTLLNVATTENLNDNDVKLSLLQAHYFLDKAIQHKSAVKLHLKRADNQYHELKRLKADSLAPSSFEKVTKIYQDKIKLIETGKIKEAIQSAEELIQEMTKLEINAINNGYLGVALAIKEQALDLDAERYAENTLNTLEKQIEETKKLIKTNYRDKHTIEEYTKKASREAHKLLTITRQIHNIHNADPEKTENTLIKHYEFIESLLTTLGLPEDTFSGSDQPYTLLTEQLSSKLDQLEQQISSQQKMIKELEQETSLNNKQRLLLPKANDTMISSETEKAVLTELMMPGGTDLQSSRSASTEVIEILD